MNTVLKLYPEIQIQNINHQDFGKKFFILFFFFYFIFLIFYFIFFAEGNTFFLKLMTGQNVNYYVCEKVLIKLLRKTKIKQNNNKN